VCPSALKQEVSLSTPEKSSLPEKRAAREILLLGATASLSLESKERLSQILKGKVDWQYLLDLAESHGIVPLIAYNLLAIGLTTQIPQSYMERLKQLYNYNLYRNIILSDELTKVLSAFSQNNIPVIVLKGTVLAEQLYGNPGLRTVGDIDIMVQPDNLPSARSVLSNLGYQKSVSEQTWVHPFHEEPYIKKTRFMSVVELHWDIDDPRLAAVPQYQIWHRAQQVEIHGSKAMVLSPEDTLLYLSNNFIKQDNQVLKSLCDIDALLKKYESSLDWEYIVASARSRGIRTSVYCSLKLAKDFLRTSGTETATAILKPSAFRLGLVNTLFNRNAFIAQVSSHKLREETANLFYCLMMDNIDKMLAVLSRYRGTENWWAWPSTIGWIVVVLGAALGRKILTLTCKQG
jgi:hypothetical protein